MSMEVDRSSPPLIVHIIFRLAMGGLENGLINLINSMPRDQYRHVIVSLTDSTDFRRRITRDDVEVITLQKKQGHDFGVYWRAWRMMRRLRPAIVHTRNLPALEFLVLAACAGTARRIHGEHGRDVYDLDGANRKYNLLRRIVNPFVHRYIAVSADLADWLALTIGIPRSEIRQIYNGVDSERFGPSCPAHRFIGPKGFVGPGTFVIGTVGRMQAVKDQLTLVRAFVKLLDRDASLRDRIRLVMVGDGPLKKQAEVLLREAGAGELAWLPGEQDDVPRLMQSMDLFVLPSLAEGISNTILEAMACGLPVVATRVGGNPELVDDGNTGTLVPQADPDAMAQAIRRYLNDEALLKVHGEAGRKRVLAQFSKDKMVAEYMAVYDSLLEASHYRKGAVALPLVT